MVPMLQRARGRPIEIVTGQDELRETLIAEDRQKATEEPTQ